MNAEVLEVINFLLDRHTVKDGLIKSLSTELDNMKKEQESAKQALVPPHPLVQPEP